MAGMGGMVAEHAGVLRDACLRRVDQAPRLRELRQGKVKAPEGRMAQPPQRGRPARQACRQGLGPLAKPPQLARKSHPSYGSPR